MHQRRPTRSLLPPGIAARPAGGPITSASTPVARARWASSGPVSQGPRASTSLITGTASAPRRPNSCVRASAYCASLCSRPTRPSRAPTHAMEAMDAVIRGGGAMARRLESFVLPLPCRRRCLRCGRRMAARAVLAQGWSIEHEQTGMCEGKQHVGQSRSVAETPVGPSALPRPSRAWTAARHAS